MLGDQINWTAAASGVFRRAPPFAQKIAAFALALGLGSGAGAVANKIYGYVDSLVAPTSTTLIVTDTPGRNTTAKSYVQSLQPSQ